LDVYITYCGEYGVCVLSTTSTEQEFYPQPQKDIHILISSSSLYT